MAGRTKDGGDNGDGRKIIVLFLEKFGYTVGDTSGRTNYLFNILEFVILTIYLILSLYNAVSSLIPAATVSLLVWMINILAMAKTCIKNIKNACMPGSNYTDTENPEFCGILKTRTKVYQIKMIFTNVITMIAGLLILYSLLFGYTSTYDPKAGVGILVVIATFIDGTLSVLENMYQAVPGESQILTMADGRK